MNDLRKLPSTSTRYCDKGTCCNKAKYSLYQGEGFNAKEYGYCDKHKPALKDSSFPEINLFGGPAQEV